MAHRDHRAVRMELEGEAHPLARRDQASHRTRSPLDQGPMERGIFWIDEDVGDDFRWFTNGRQGVLVQGESEGKARPSATTDPREPESNETTVRDALATEVLHGPPERASDSLERRRDFRGPVLVQCGSDSAVCDKVSAGVRVSGLAGKPSPL